MRYDAVLFDVDGTLIHSAPGIYKAFAYTFAKLGLDPDGIDVSRYLGPPLRWSFAQHFDTPEMVEHAVATYRAFFKSNEAPPVTLFPGVSDMLARLHGEGVFLATATSKMTQTAAQALRETGVLQYFDLVGGASMDASIDTKTAVIQQDLKDARLAGKRILMVGDRQDDMKGAADCGLPAAGVLYGYGSRQELEAWQPVYLAHTCAELTDYILEKQE